MSDTPLPPSRTMILMLTALLFAACDEGSGDTTRSKTKDKTKDEAPSAAVADEYAQPSDLCALADPTLLGAEAGKPNEGYVEKEDISFKMSGCIVDMVAPDAINTFKLFVAVNGDAAAHYEGSDKIWTDTLMVPGWTADHPSDLGTKAIYAVRLSAENRRIDTVLALYDGSLYLETRFLGGGSKEWDAGAIRKGLLSIARGAMSKVPRE